MAFCANKNADSQAAKKIISWINWFHSDFALFLVPAENSLLKSQIKTQSTPNRKFIFNNYSYNSKFIKANLSLMAPKTKQSKMFSPQKMAW